MVVFVCVVVMFVVCVFFRKSVLIVFVYGCVFFKKVYVFCVVVCFVVVDVCVCVCVCWCVLCVCFVGFCLGGSFL